MKDFCLLVKDQDQSCDSQQGLSFDDKTDGMKKKMNTKFVKLRNIHVYVTSEFRKSFHNFQV